MRARGRAEGAPVQVDLTRVRRAAAAAGGGQAEEQQKQAPPARPRTGPKRARKPGLFRRRARRRPAPEADPDIALRRRQVAEQQARSLLRRSMMILAALAAAGGIAWLLNSPYLSIDEVVVTGASNAAVDEILARHRVVEGRPLASVRAGAVEESLLADPWVVSASVKLVFPTRIEVYVQERSPVAWLPVEDSWALLAEDGAVVYYADSSDSARSGIHIQSEDPGLGGEVENDYVYGALRFLEGLPSGMAAESAVRVIEGELWAKVEGRAVRLGSPVDMASKAESLQAVIGAAPGGVIDVTAPGRPSVRPWERIAPLERSDLSIKLQLEP